MPCSIPTVHLNGTSHGELTENYLKAHRAICDALAAMRQASPNGRDYYPQGDRAINVAIDEHTARLARVEAVRDDIEDILFGISAQSGLRRQQAG